MIKKLDKRPHIKIPHIQSQEWWPQGDTPRPRSRAAAVLCWSSCEEIPRIQGKRNPVRRKALREGLRGQTDWNHNHRKLANLITGTTALTNSMKLSHAVTPLQYSCLGNPMDRAAPWGRWESDTTDWLDFDALEKEMATHSSVLAWRIPGMGEPGGLPSMGSHRVGHDWVTSLSCIGEGNGNPLQCSCLENPRDGGAWWAAVYGVTQSRTWLTQLSSSSKPCSM